MKLIELSKVCTKCEERKNWKKFDKSKKGRFGITSVCKICLYKKYHYSNNLRSKIHYKANKEKILKYSKKYRKENKEKIKKKDKHYRNNNKEKVIIFRKIYYKTNRDKVLAQQKIYFQVNKEKRNVYYKKRRKTDIKFKLNSNISFHINHSLKKGNGKEGRSWKDMVPYTLHDLIKRLKKTLPVGYTWDDYISGKADLHIDHIIPIAVHNFKSYTDTDFQRCWALKNLQLLPAKDNMSKGAKLIKPFQPSLLL